MKTILTLLLVLSIQAQEVCLAMVYPCEIDAVGNIVPVGITENAGSCYTSAKNTCERLLEYTCKPKIEEEVKVADEQILGLSIKVKSLNLENVKLKKQVRLLKRRR